MPWDILLLLMAYSFMSWFNRVSMSVAGSEQIIRTDLLDKTQMGDIYSALVLSYALCMIPGGWLVDRFGPRACLVFMGFGSAFFVFLTGVAGDVLSQSQLYAGLLTVRALMGVCTAPIYPAAGRTVVLQMPVHRRAESNGLITGSALLGIAASPFVFGTLIDHYGWQNAFRVTGVITAALALCWFVVTASQSHRAARRQLMSVAKEAPMFPEWRLFAKRSIILLTIAYGAVGYIEDLFYFWTEHYFLDVLHLDKSTSRAYTTVLYVAMAFGMFAGGWTGDRLCRSFGLRAGRIWLPVGGLVAGVGFVGLALAANSPGQKVAFFALALAAVGLCEGPIWTTAVELGGRRGGLSGSIVNAGGNLGGMPAPALTPRIGNAYGWNWAIAVVVPICLIGGLLLAFVNPREKLPEEVDRADDADATKSL